MRSVHGTLHACAVLLANVMPVSGGARVFAARGKRLCFRPRQSDQFCNQGIFQAFGHGGVNQPVGPTPLPSSIISSPPLFPSHSPIPHLLPSPLLTLGP